MGPVAGADADDATGADAFDDEIGLELDLDAAAAERGVSGCLIFKLPVFTIKHRKSIALRKCWKLLFSERVGGCKTIAAD